MKRENKILCNGDTESFDRYNYTQLFWHFFNLRKNTLFGHFWHLLAAFGTFKNFLALFVTFLHVIKRYKILCTKLIIMQLVFFKFWYC